MDALIFDMDGVIVDSELHWKSLEGYFLRSLVPAWKAVDQGRIIGLSIDSLYAMLTGEYGLQLPKGQFLALYHGMASEIYGQKSSLIDGFRELLADLTRNNVPLALASSSPRDWIDILLDRFDLRSSFRVVVSADELQGEGKPSPAIYLLTAKRLGIDPQGCVVIEDSNNGVLSAKAAGMYCIGFRNGFNQEQDLSSADLIINKFAELDYQTLNRLRS